MIVVDTSNEKYESSLPNSGKFFESLDFKQKKYLTKVVH